MIENLNKQFNNQLWSINESKGVLSQFLVSLRKNLLQNHAHVSSQLDEVMRVQNIGEDKREERIEVLIGYIKIPWDHLETKHKNWEGKDAL